MTTLSPLASVAATRKVLDLQGLTTKYSFGQNFLVNDAILQKIIELAQVNADDSVLEIGPGIGTLSIALLKCAKRLASVECDSDLPPVLKHTLSEWWDRFELIEKDALDLVPADVSFAPNKLVANLPYAVAATVALDCFQNFPTLESETIMVQKEVADRMAAQPGTKLYGAYTVKLRLYAEPTGRFKVGPGNFFPPPRVESSVIRLDRHTVYDEEGVVLTADELRLTALLADAGFATRRKTIANSFKTFLSARGKKGSEVIGFLPELFKQAGIDPRQRGEALEVLDYIRLTRACQARGIDTL